jgi:hypothetical protein
MIIKELFLAENAREGNAYKRLVDQFPHLENVIGIIADHKKAGAALTKWLFSRFVEGSAEEIHPIEDAITSIKSFADSFEKIESKWRTGAEFKKAVSEFFETPAWEKENSILAIIPRMTADQIDKLPGLSSREKAFFEINVSEEEMESDRVGRVGPWNLWMPTSRERSCKIAEFDPVTREPKTTWCTARMAGSNLFYNYVGRPGENMTLFYVIKQDPRTDDEKKRKIPDPRGVEDWLSVGFVNSVPELSGKSGGMSVDRANEGLTEARLRSILGPHYDKIMQALVAKNEALGGKHPARARIEEAALDPAVFESLIRGLGKEELEDMKKIILQEPDVHPAIIAKLALDKSPSIRTSVAHHSSVDAETLRMLAADESLSVRRAVATKPKTPVDVLELMADDRALWPYVAQNRRIPVEKLFVIAEDPRMEVIRALLMNINLPEEILQKFEQSDDKRVRWQASGLRTRKNHAQGLSENHLRSMIREVVSAQPRMGQLRRIIREEMISEDERRRAAMMDDIEQEISFSGALSRPTNIRRRFGSYAERRKEGRTQAERQLKRIWNTHADRDFFDNRLVKLHSIGLYAEDVGTPLAFLKAHVGKTNRDELSALGWRESALAPGWSGNGYMFGVFVDGRVTYAAAADQMTEWTSMATDIDRQRHASSGFPKRPYLISKQKVETDIVLDEEDWVERVENQGPGGDQEIVVANWQIRSFVVNSRSAPGGWLRDGSWAEEDFTFKLITFCRKIGLPIVDETGVPYEITEPEPKREEEVGDRFDNASLW